VTAGRAYRFSLRIANRDGSADRGSGLGAFSGFGLTAVDGGHDTCSFANIHPDRPANVSVTAENPPTLTVTKALARPRAAADDQFAVQIKDAGGLLINSTTGSTTTGEGGTVDAGTGTTGPTPVTAGETYTLTEVGVGPTQLAPYHGSISCANAATHSSTVLPSGAVDLDHPPTVTPRTGDAITCVLTNTVPPAPSRSRTPVVRSSTPPRTPRPPAPAPALRSLRPRAMVAGVWPRPMGAGAPAPPPGGCTRQPLLRR
jgi:hypothetical protein